MSYEVHTTWCGGSEVREHEGLMNSRVDIDRFDTETEALKFWHEQLDRAYANRNDSNTIEHITSFLFFSGAEYGQDDEGEETFRGLIEMTAHVMCVDNGVMEAVEMLTEPEEDA